VTPADISAAPLAVTRPVLFKRITGVVASDYGITTEDLASPSRARNLLEPRRVAMTIARTLTGWSYARIGKRLNRDHTSVIAGITAVTQRAEADADFASRIARLSDQARNSAHG